MGDNWWGNMDSSREDATEMVKQLQVMKLTRKECREISNIIMKLLSFSCSSCWGLVTSKWPYSPNRWPNFTLKTSIKGIVFMKFLKMIFRASLHLIYTQKSIQGPPDLSLLKLFLKSRHFSVFTTTAMSTFCLEGQKGHAWILKDESCGRRLRFWARELFLNCSTTQVYFWAAYLFYMSDLKNKWTFWPSWQKVDIADL